MSKKKSFSSLVVRVDQVAREPFQNGGTLVRLVSTYNYDLFCFFFTYY